MKILKCFFSYDNMVVREEEEVSLNEKFFELKKEKQDRMINAALKIFAKNGYQKASTDDIVKEAGISKGLLFHYFGSKSGVYTFAYTFSARFMALELQRAVSMREIDLFRLMIQIEKAKAVLLHNYPYMQKFLQTYRDVDDKEILEDIAPHIESIPKIMSEIMARADLSQIKDGVDTELLIRSMNYTTRGLTEASFESSMSSEEVFREAEAYLSMMRLQFTKEAYLQN